MNMWVGILTAAVASGVALLLATLGEILSERAGILNLGVEGMVLVGAVSGFIAVQATGSLALAILFAMLAGGAMALIHAVLSITLKANQVVSGLALTIFGGGLSSFMGASYIGQMPRAAFQAIPIPVLSDIPVLGAVFFRHNIIVYAAMLLVPLLSVLMFKTRWGLSIRSVGENPAAADAAGIGVFGIRYACTIGGGMLSGLSGAYLSLAYNASWVENISAGMGWIAVALSIFALWRPGGALIGALLFGGISVLGLRLQAYGIHIPIYLFSMLPYISTIAVLILVTSSSRVQSRAPAALGGFYDREAR